MDSRKLDLAAEFCKLVGTPDLLEYLGLPSDAAPDEAQEKLKARRKRMQGMQGNPKYKKEALFLIKHFNSLSTVLGDPDTYVDDAVRRAESVHLPILEMTVKGVLGAGTLTGDQEDYLRRNAIELGVSEQTFEDLLDRLASEAGIQRTRAAPSKPPEPEERVDFYKLFGVDAHATKEEIRDAYEAKLEEAKQIRDTTASERVVSRVEIAWQVLSNAAARAQYDLSSSRTGPPARNRERRPAQAATAPPVRPRSGKPTGTPGTPAATPGGSLPSRLEIHGEPVRRVRVASSSVHTTVEIHNGGDAPMPGAVSSDQGWLLVTPSVLDPTLKSQDIDIEIDPLGVPAGGGTASVTITTEKGETARIVFDVQRGRDPLMLAAAGLGGLVIIVLAFAVAYGLYSSM